jgi:5-methylcytosine-specific restriction endonuclease McrA
MATSQADLILEYFKQNPNRPIPHAEVVDWATAEWERLTGEKFRDPDRAIRKWHQLGHLQKIGKGVYLYDPHAVQVRQLEDFTAEIREAIFIRDGYRCVVCGLGRENGVEIHADHIKPKDKGGKATLENGQTLCASHNFLKKNYNQTELSKRLFLRLLRTARANEDAHMIAFCEAILAIYDQYGIDTHITD